MALENVIAYVVVLGLPIWLVAEELIHRFGARREAEAAVPVRANPSVGRADLKRRAA